MLLESQYDSWLMGPISAFFTSWKGHDVELGLDRWKFLLF